MNAKKKKMGLYYFSRPACYVARKYRAYGEQKMHLIHESGQ
jgi:hypothetical protein